MTHPNIILIVFDTLRADRVLCEYENKNLSPYINKLLDNSIYFENCISNSPWTLTSHISIFTGLFPSQSRVIHKKISTLNNKIPILAEILKEMGYNTICYTENPYINKVFGLTRGFDEVIDEWYGSPWFKKNYKLSQFMKLLKKINSFIRKQIKSKLFLKFWWQINRKTQKSIKFIIKNLFLENFLYYLKNKTINDLEKFNQILKNTTKNKPYYLFFNIMTNHDPYIPLRKAFNDFDITIKDFKIIRDILIEPLKYRLEVNMKSKHLSEKKVKTLKKLYNACVFSSDIIVKKLFEILKNFNLLENSYVIITSDHGEHLGDQIDHYLWEHFTYYGLYRSVLRVPLIIYNSNFEKNIIEKQVQLKDLFHTILHLTGIPLNENKYLEIKNSIIYQINNNSTPEYIFGEYLKPKEDLFNLINDNRKTINKNLIPKLKNDLIFLRSNKYKYIRFKENKIEEFYDLINDSYEQNNIASKENKNFKDMKLEMKNILNIIKSSEELTDTITEKEKDLIIKNINKLRIKGI